MGGPPLLPPPEELLPLSPPHPAAAPASASAAKVAGTSLLRIANLPSPCFAIVCTTQLQTIATPSGRLVLRHSSCQEGTGTAGGGTAVDPRTMSVVGSTTCATGRSGPASRSSRRSAAATPRS